MESKSIRLGIGMIDGLMKFESIVAANKDLYAVDRGSD